MIDFSHNYFSGVQFCLSKNGAEKVSHCLQAIIDSDSSLDIFTPDANNAFNSLNIKRSLHQVKSNFPSILPFLRQIYGESSTAWYELISDSVVGISKQEGVDQGCASASFMYSIGIHPLLQQIKSIIGDQGFMKFFADDGNIVAPASKMACIINLLTSCGPSVGYSMNKSKGTYLIGKCQSYDEAISKKNFLISLDFVPSDSIIIHPSNLPSSTPLYGVIAVGSPVGTDTFIKNFLDSKIQKLSSEADSIISLPDPQSKHLILKYSFSQKINFLLRTTSPTLNKSFVSKFSVLKRKIFNSIFGRPVSDVCWRQCSLPTSMGGLGYGNSALTSIVANIASVYDSGEEIVSLLQLKLISDNSLKKIKRCLSSLQVFNELSNPNPTPSSPHFRKLSDLLPLASSGRLQSSLMSKLRDFSATKFISELSSSTPDPQDLIKKKVYFSSLSGELSSQWLNKCPTSDDFTLTADQFRVLLFKRLMVPLHTFVRGSKCRCGKSIDESGNHFSSSCNVGSSLHNIHNSVLRTVDKAARSHGLNTTLELATFSSPHDPLSDKRPDLVVTNWPSGNSLKVIDLAVTNPVSSTLQYSLTPNLLDHQRLLKKREAQKVTKYSSLVHQKGGEFEPLVIGASGAITATAKKLLQVICSSQDNPTSRTHRCSYEFWLAKISFSLHKSIASEIIVRSAKVNGRQFSASNSFPDSVDIHLEMNG